MVKTGLGHLQNILHGSTEPHPNDQISGINLDLTLTVQLEYFDLLVQNICECGAINGIFSDHLWQYCNYFLSFSYIKIEYKSYAITPQICKSRYHSYGISQCTLGIKALHDMAYTIKITIQIKYGLLHHLVYGDVH